jgi:hypothetical protein
MAIWSHCWTPIKVQIACAGPASDLGLGCCTTISGCSRVSEIAAGESCGGAGRGQVPLWSRIPHENELKDTFTAEVLAQFHEKIGWSIRIFSGLLICKVAWLNVHIRTTWDRSRRVDESSAPFNVCTREQLVRTKTLRHVLKMWIVGQL